MQREQSHPLYMAPNSLWSQTHPWELILQHPQVNYRGYKNGETMAAAGTSNRPGFFSGNNRYIDGDGPMPQMFTATIIRENTRRGPAKAPEFWIQPRVTVDLRQAT